MRIKEKECILNDGRKVVLRSPEPQDAQTVLDYLKQTAGETRFLVRYPEECRCQIEAEEKFLESVCQDEKNIMMGAFVDGKMIANSSLMGKGGHIKYRHRASFGIAIVEEYWNSGLGTLLTKEILEYAQKAGFEQVELGVYEDNPRAIHLYEKLGFQKYGIIPKAFKLKDDTYRDEVQMIYYCNPVT